MTIKRRHIKMARAAWRVTDNQLVRTRDGDAWCRSTTMLQAWYFAAAKGKHQ